MHPPPRMEAPDSEGRRTIPREQDAPRALIVLMILLMLGGVAGALAWIQRANVAGDVVGRPTPLARAGPIFTVNEILEEPAKGNLLGRDVAIWRTPVQDVSGDFLFWVGPDSTRVVPVVLLGEETGRQVERQTVVERGDTVALFGYVRAVRDASLVDGPVENRIAEWRRLARSMVYISALQVEHLARSGPPRP